MYIRIIDTRDMHESIMVQMMNCLIKCSVIFT